MTNRPSLPDWTYRASSSDFEARFWNSLTLVNGCGLWLRMTLVITSPSRTPASAAGLPSLTEETTSPLRSAGRPSGLARSARQRLDLQPEPADRRLGRLGLLGLALRLFLLHVEHDLVGRRRRDRGGLAPCPRAGTRARTSARPRWWRPSAGTTACRSTFSPANEVITSPCLRPALSAGLPGTTSPTRTPLVVGSRPSWRAMFGVSGARAMPIRA